MERPHNLQSWHAAPLRLSPPTASSLRYHLDPVPGAVELTYAAARVIEHQHPDAVIVFGAVVRGDTPHFDYVCESVTQGVTLLNSTGDVPVIFGLLTVDNEQQALDRIGGPAGHKGVEVAETAIRMIALASSI